MWFQIEHTVCGCPRLDVGHFWVSHPSGDKGFARCPNCGQHIPLEVGVIMSISADLPHGAHMGKYVERLPPMPLYIEVGDWVLTERWGEAVVVALGPKAVHVRYSAKRESDGAQLWVLNSENFWEVEHLRLPTRTSRAVTKLSGPYGLETP